MEMNESKIIGLVVVGVVLVAINIVANVMNYDTLKEWYDH